MSWRGQRGSKTASVSFSQISIRSNRSTTSTVTRSAIRSCASSLRSLEDTVREIDLAGRWGGEEFALILPGTDSAAGAAVAERARRAIELRGIPASDGQLVAMTASFGVAAFPENGDFDALVAAADEALYRAKRAGRNRIANATDVVSR